MSHLSIEPICRLEFGPGVVQRLPEFVAEAGGHRVFVVTDKGLRAAGIADKVLSGLDAAGMESHVYDGIGPNPSTSNVDEGAAAARVFGDAVVVALGGGSVLDAAKGIALLARNTTAVAADADSLWDAADGLPLVAVPTTSGTGAETNGFGVIEDSCARRKVYLGHASVKPRIAVLDPELTLGLPQRVTAATGFDALVHAIESLASRSANPVSAAYATQAVTMVSQWLPVAYRDGADLAARAQLMLGAHLAGRALTISGLGLVHGIGHAVTAHTGTPHGVALAAVLEEVMEFTAESAGPAYEQAGRAMLSRTGAAIDTVREMSGVLDIKRPLRELNVVPAMLPSIAAAAVADPVTRNSPLLPTETEVADILASVY
ncbi:iron-containing alcohol dehydrogenase [Amycolatopsis sp.]|jgi:alcohol dehydrogenase|uniref:iron-containing alcohol dehydrogenase family protein n=1 Tax=Amycolatopsis sp. TaxID=37632 RepID=UPI002DFEE5AC|nr:iron-containing alcohol dehydrogenase [Amycolatopsis sp.]